MSTTYFCASCDQALPPGPHAVYAAESASEQSSGTSDSSPITLILCTECDRRLSPAERGDLAKRRAAISAGVTALLKKVEALVDLRWASDPLLRATAEQMTAFHAAFRVQAARAAGELREVAAMASAIPPGARDGLGTAWLASLGALADAYDRCIAESLSASERLERRSQAANRTSDGPA